MSIVTGAALDPARFFKPGSLPVAQGSSFDLSIGKIYDEKGQEIPGPFVLAPNAMVQVVSAEVFNLPPENTGHVTYKTGLTREGIWALTVGIVDPGWDGPIATTLLNFSRVDHTIHVGQAFLRVTLFEHPPVPKNLLRKARPLDQYLRGVQSFASSRFPPTFLDSNRIAAEAANNVMEKMRKVALQWLGLTALLFAAIQVLAPPISRVADGWFPPATVSDLQAKFETLQERFSALEAKQNGPTFPAAPSTPSSAARQPEASTPASDASNRGD